MKPHAASRRRSLLNPALSQASRCSLFAAIAAATAALTSPAAPFEPSYDLGQAPRATIAAPAAAGFGKAAGDAAGRVVRTGDLNGDGIGDLIVSSPLADIGAPVRTDAGTIAVWFGAAELDSTLDVAGLAGTAPGLTIWGATAGDQIGIGGAIALADVNGDGIADLILGSSAGDGPLNARSNAGEVAIIFGRPAFPALLDLSVQGSGGADVTIYGATADDNLTSSGAIAAADVNGDGIADLIVGAPLADGAAEARLSAGEGFIVFGRPEFPAVLDLAVAGSNGADVTLHAPTAGDFLTFGGALAAGDVNGDGMADVILGAIGGDGPAESRSSAGEVFVVFGRASFPPVIALEATGGDGANVTIWGASGSDQVSSGGAIGIGDFDGDGLADIILGAAGGDGPNETRNGAGEVYVIRGRESFSATVDLAAVGENGPDLVIFAPTSGDTLTTGGGLAVGDINRDGFSDLLLGAPAADGPGETRSSAGEAFVVFGRTIAAPVIDLADQENGADVIIWGATAGDNLSSARALRLADIDGNGFADILLGAPLADGPGETRTNGGEAYLIRGSPTLPRTIDLAAAGDGRTTAVIFGATANDQLTSSGAMAAGDLNGDGVADILLGASGGDGPAEGRLNAGEFSVIFGVGVPEFDLAAAPGGEVLNGGNRSFGLVGIDGTRRMSFTIQNSGAAPLTDISAGIESGDAGAFAIIETPAETIAAGGQAALRIAFTPAGLGSYAAVLRLCSNDEDEGEFTVTLTGECVPPIPPVVETLPADPVSTVGATLHARVSAAGFEREVVFEYGTTPGYGTTVAAAPGTVDGNDDIAVSVTLTGLQPRTIYYFRARAFGELGAAAGDGMTFETANRPPVARADHAIVLPGASIAIDCLTNDSDPDGDTLVLQSFTKPLPASDGKVERSGNLLIFTASDSFSGATFAYSASDGFGGVATGTVTVERGVCTLNPAAVTVPAAGASYEVAVAANGAWAVDENLPWIAASPAGGFGHGTVRVTVDPHQANNTRSRSLLIGGEIHTITQSGGKSGGGAGFGTVSNGFPAGLAGSFEGLIERHPVVNSNLAGRLDLTTTATGAFTAKLTVGTAASAVSGVFESDAAEPHLWRAAASAAGPNGTPLTLEMMANLESGALTGILRDGAANVADITGWQTGWHADHNREALTAQIWSFELAHPATADAWGSGNLSVTGSSGAVAVAGRTASNRVFTCGSVIGRQGQVAVYGAFNGQPASLAGAAILQPDAADAPAALTGLASWFATGSAAGGPNKKSEPIAPADPLDLIFLLSAGTK